MKNMFRTGILTLILSVILAQGMALADDSGTTKKKPTLQEDFNTALEMLIKRTNKEENKETDRGRNRDASEAIATKIGNKLAEARDTAEKLESNKEKRVLSEDEVEKLFKFTVVVSQFNLKNGPQAKSGDGLNLENTTRLFEELIYPETVRAKEANPKLAPNKVIDAFAFAFEQAISGWNPYSWDKDKKRCMERRDYTYRDAYNMAWDFTRQWVDSRSSGGNRSRLVEKALGRLNSKGSGKLNKSEGASADDTGPRTSKSYSEDDSPSPAPKAPRSEGRPLSVPYDDDK